VSKQRIIATSAAPPNGNGNGTALALDLDGYPLGIFQRDARIGNPRGLCDGSTGELPYLNTVPIASSRWTPALASCTTLAQPLGRTGRGQISGPTADSMSVFAPISAFPATLAAAPERMLPTDIVPFPRGFAFAPDGRLFL
jgi:hypothetical protein